jgi:general secretion pathway protein G
VLDKIMADKCFVNECSLLFKQLTSRIERVKGFGNDGFTLIELIVVCAILGVLASMAIPAYNSYMDSARNVSCASDIRTIEKAITAYLLENNKSVPEANLSDMGITNLLDPWKRNYVYTLHTVPEDDPAALKDVTAAKDLNSDYDLYSMGKDGESDLDPGSKTVDDIVRSYDGNFVGLRP